MTCGTTSPTGLERLGGHWKKLRTILGLPPSKGPFQLSCERSLLDKSVRVHLCMEARNVRNKAEKMQSRQDIMSLVKSLPRRYRFTVLRNFLVATGLLIALEAITAIIIQIISAQRKRFQQEG